MLKAMGCGLAAAIVSLAGAVSAQDAGKPPTYGVIRLRAGFAPDPRVISLTAGGSVDASAGNDLPETCSGWIAAAPDIEVAYEAAALPLVFRSASSMDTALVVRGPDGLWRCDAGGYEAGAGKGGAEVRFERPRSGAYKVWIGVLGAGPASADLLITEAP